MEKNFYKKIHLIFMKIIYSVFISTAIGSIKHIYVSVYEKMKLLLNASCRMIREIKAFCSLGLMLPALPKAEKSSTIHHFTDVVYSGAILAR